MVLDTISGEFLGRTFLFDLESFIIFIMNQPIEIQRVIALLTWWGLQIKFNNYVSLTDINKFAEGFVAKLLNFTDDLNLRKLEYDTPNHEAIDLGDENAKIAFQVTSKVDTEKIVTNVSNFFKNYADTYTNGIRFLLLSDDDHEINLLRKRKSLTRIDSRFKPLDHIHSYKYLIRKITALYDKDRERFDSVLELMEKEIGTKMPSTRLLTLPPPENADLKLLGRETDLEQLVNLLQQKKHLLLVNGLGGIGKTELCKRFFLDHYQEYESAAWVDYRGSLEQSLITALAKSFALDLNENPAKLLDVVLETLLKLGDRLLVVVDNIEDPEDKNLLQLRSLPAVVLVTSRNKIAGFSLYPLEVLSEPACMELFYKFYTSKGDEEAVKAMIQLSGCHTLTIELLARTATNAGLTAAELYQLLKAKGFDLSQEVKEGVATYWHDESKLKPFYHHLQTLFAISALTPQEEKIAMNVSLLPAQFISRRTIKELLKLESLDGLTGLLTKGWLKADEKSNAAVMHQVVSHVLRSQTKPDAHKCTVLIDSLKWKLYPKPGDNPLTRAEWVDFAAQLLSFITDNDKNLAALANNLSAIYLALGQMEKALAFQEKAIQIREAVLAPNHSDLAQSYNNLSAIYQALGQMEKALEFQEKAIQILEVVLAPNHPHLAASYNNLSAIYQALGQMEKALEFQEKAIQILEVVLAPNHPHLAASYNNLSAIYQALGQMEKALEFQEKAIKIREAVLAPNHPDLATSYNNLSTIHQALGQMEKALAFQEKAIQIREAVLAPNHPDFAQSYNNLSLIYLDLNNLDSARFFSQKAVHILRTLFPGGHPNLEIVEKTLVFIEERMKLRREEVDAARDKE